VRQEQGMNAKEKLNAALELVAPGLREEFLKDLANRPFYCIPGGIAIARREYHECIAQALESVSVDPIRDRWNAALNQEVKLCQK
jgi:hypothetical protein